MEIKDAAVAKLKEILAEEKKGSCLRIFMQGGCCGATVAMDIAGKPEKEDIEIAKDGLKVYVHKDAAAQLVTATLDCDKAGGIIIKGMPKDGGCGCH
ncbi:MAG: hypothetical protein A2234_05180 [Elusimicrobia bacterium RIFOXYA2_FULL_58_8]|nr:MAG: hypothetical protein A2234_05180 [Elusimicrobia bacterium RIFOXYA2_FULL_58_8]OGS14357.1 MAG: hypothetical protein A2285_06705 [Elusimicrobia bacterium RIFOXYA12_FULL_57_11]